VRKTRPPESPVDALARLLRQPPRDAVLSSVSPEVRDEIFSAVLAGADAATLVGRYGDLKVRTGFRRCALREVDRPFLYLFELVRLGREMLGDFDRRIKDYQRRRDALAELLSR